MKALSKNAIKRRCNTCSYLKTKDEFNDYSYSINYKCKKCTAKELAVYNVTRRIRESEKKTEYRTDTRIEIIEGNQYLIIPSQA